MRTSRPTIPVALCADKNFEVGLHVTLYSLLRSASRHLTIYLISPDLDVGRLDRIRQTLREFEGRCTIHAVEQSAEAFAGFRSLVGNHYTYTRLLLPRLLNEPTAVYLDSDLVVNLDIAALFDEPLNGHPFGAVSTQPIRWSLEREFFRSLGLHDEARYFNAGILLLDLEQWRTKGLTDRCLGFADQHASKLLAADQTVLNSLFSGDFQSLPSKYNATVYATTPRVASPAPDAIYHFVGNPKPWGLLAQYTHKNYPLFAEVLKRTYFRDHSAFGWAETMRAARLVRSYAHALRHRFG